MYDALRAESDETLYRLGGDRRACLQVVRGVVVVNGIPLGAGDGAALSRESSSAVRAREDAEVMIFDLASGGRDMGETVTGGPVPNLC